MRARAKKCLNASSLTSNQLVEISKRYNVSYSSIKLLNTNYSPILGCEFVVDTPKGVKNVYLGGFGELLSD